MLTTSTIARAAWPAFLMASVLELVVFAMVDPADVQWMGHPLEISRSSVYSLGFFLFWGICFFGNVLMMFLNCATCPGAGRR